MRSLKGFVLSICFLSALSLHAADEATAFQLMEEGNRYVGEQAKDRVVQVRSEKSVGSLSPKVWFVVYYDPTANFKSVEVKFAAGKMIDVKRPFRLIETITSNTREMDRDKLKIDSDKAVEIALKDPMLENITPKAVRLELERSDAGPVWKIRIWAAKLRNPSDQVDIGELILTADDGTVIKNDLKIDRVD